MVGEVVALAIVLLPALYLFRWTVEGTFLGPRGAMQVVLSGMLFLFLMPEVVFALKPGVGWAPLFSMPRWELQIGVQVILLVAVFGVSAVQEFVQRGEGTPIPYDPPKRLVTSGVYRYCANPMQLSCAVVMLLWAAMLRNWWMAGAAVMAAVYSAGIAWWDETQDLAVREGEAWRAYRAEVKAWRLRWRPYHAGEPARLYVANTCGVCREVRKFLERRGPLGLELIAAETLPQGSIRRLRYVDGDECLEGVRAFARALEHLNLGWAYCGMTLRLPLVRWVMQVLGDGCGFGPREICAWPDATNPQ